MFSPIITQDIEIICKELGNDLYQCEGKNILITGASGMLASYLVFTLLHANARLFNKPAQIYLITRSGKEKFGRNKNIHYLAVDIVKEKPQVKNIHYIIHAASKAAPKLYKNSKIDTLNTNILGLYNVLSLCTAKTKSFLFFSSAEIYGSPKGDKPISEDYVGMTDHLNDRSCYVEGKRAGETICMNYFWEKKLPIKIARIFHTFGPGLNLDDGRVFSDFIRMGQERKDILIQGDPTLQRSMLYVADAAIMFFKILLSDKNGEVYNVGSEKNNVSIKKFADIVRDEFNHVSEKKIHVVIKKDLKNLYFKYAVATIRPSLRKFKREFGYVPKTSVKHIVENTITYLLQTSH